MYDLTTLNRRYFGVKIGGTSLQLLPPKLKVLRRFENMSKEDTSIEDIVDILASILSKNKENKTVTSDFVEDNFDTDEMTALLEVYFNWVGEANNNPN